MAEASRWRRAHPVHSLCGDVLISWASCVNSSWDIENSRALSSSNLVVCGQPVDAVWDVRGMPRSIAKDAAFVPGWGVVVLRAPDHQPQSSERRDGDENSCDLLQ